VEIFLGALKVHIPEDGPETPRHALTPTSRPAGVQDGRQGTAEAQRNDPQQHQELRRILRHAEDGEEKRAEILREFEDLQQPHITGQQVQGMKRVHRVLGQGPRHQKPPKH